MAQNNQRKITYGYDKKGARFENNKPSSSNAYNVTFDTGNAYVVGKVYDHHQLVGDAKEKYPSASALIFANSKSFYESVKDEKNLEFICHDYPDNDAIISLTLATIYMQTQGKNLYVTKELTRIANESDTFTFKPEFNFGTLLSQYIRQEFPDDKDIRDKHMLEKVKKEAITRCVDFCYRMALTYDNLANKIKDPEIRKNFTLEQMLKEIMKPNSEFSKENPMFSRNLRVYQSQINIQAQKDKAEFKKIPRVTVKDRDKQQEEILKNKGFYKGYDSYDVMSVNLCKKQLTKEDMQKPLETAKKPTTVFIYTGTKKPSNGLKIQARDNYDVTIFPSYDNEKGTVTYKISSTNPDYDLGHLGRYIETMMYKEKLNFEDSKIKDLKEFEKERERFIWKLVPLGETQEKKHFTSYDSIAGNDPSFFGFTVNEKSNFYDLGTLKGIMQDYFENPQKIEKDDFIKMIGEDNFYEIDKDYRPNRYVPKFQEKDLTEKQQDELVDSKTLEEISDNNLGKVPSNNDINGIDETITTNTINKDTDGMGV